MRTRPQARTTRTAERFPRGSEGAAPISRQGPQRRRQGLRSPRPRRHRARARAPLLRRQSRGPTTALLRPRPGRPLSRRRARSTARRTLRFGTWKHACKQAAPRSWWSSPPWGWCGGRVSGEGWRQQRRAPARALSVGGQRWSRRRFPAPACLLSLSWLPCLAGYERLISPELRAAVIGAVLDAITENAMPLLSVRPSSVAAFVGDRFPAYAVRFALARLGREHPTQAGKWCVSARRAARFLGRQLLDLVRQQAAGKAGVRRV